MPKTTRSSPASAPALPATRSIVEFFERADLLVGIGFEPVESDKLWHQTMPLVSLGPVRSRPVSSGRARKPSATWRRSLADARRRGLGSIRLDADDDAAAFASELRVVLAAGGAAARALRLRADAAGCASCFPRDTILATDVGSIKIDHDAGVDAYEPLTFFESNGLSAMGYAFPAAMAARLQFPDRPILCTIGDGGFGMTLAEIETCVRERLHFVTVVYNDSSLSLIDVAQQNRGYPTLGVQLRLAWTSRRRRRARRLVAAGRDDGRARRGRA